MKRVLFLLLWSFIFCNSSYASEGDTIHVVSHDHVTMTTNPAAGANFYPAWAVFPSTATQYRKIIMTLHYECPDGMACGEWDYIDEVKLRRTGGVAGDDHDLVIHEYITPYGNSFGTDWYAEFKLDVTDYSMFLHDSVEIEYVHTGYETNVGKGWAVTVAFDCIEGTPAMEAIKVTKLWDGSFPFGNDANPIENYLTPITFTTDPQTALARFRITQSGHGADDHYCSEFCSKYRKLFFDGILIDTKTIWRTCGYNPIYPQGGTWVYDRSNWCPGLPVRPDIYNFPVTGNSSHTIDIDMQTYSSSSPSANYYIKSQLIEYKAPAHVNDASLDLMMTPSNDFEYHRLNPICDNPSVVLKNNGSADLTSAEIWYGADDHIAYSYTWTGNLATGYSEEIDLSGLLITGFDGGNFKAFLHAVNGGEDEYHFDDTLQTYMAFAPAYDSVLVFFFKSNLLPAESSYTITDANGTVWYQRTPGSLTSNTFYYDTLHLAPGCYTLLFKDSGGDGLSFWANPGQGSGLAVLKTNDGIVLKSFNPDFGSEIRWNFSVQPGLIQSAPIVQQPVYFDVYPNPAKDDLFISVSFPTAESCLIDLYDLNGNKVASQISASAADHLLTIPVTSCASGMYIVKLTTKEGTQEKKVMITR